MSTTRLFQPLLFLAALCVGLSSPFPLQAATTTTTTTSGTTTVSAATTASASIAPNVVRVKAGGVDLLVYRTGVKNVVTLRGSLPAGDSFAAPGQAAVPTLTGMLLDKGTTTHDQFAIASALEAVGAELDFSVRGVMLEISGKCLTKDLPLLVSLLAEQLRTPALSTEELEKAKKQYEGSLRRRQENPSLVASDAFSRALFPVGHPNRAATVEEMMQSIESTTIEQVRAFHAAHYGPAALVLVAVGDLETDLLAQEVTAAFSSWSGGVQCPAITPAPAPQLARQEFPMQDKPSVSVYWGQATGLRYTDPDALALRVGTAIFGSGFTGRLMSTVRDKEGLTYGIYARVTDDTFADGDWYLDATFAPAMLAKGLESSKRELMLWYEQGITADELERRKSNLVGSYKVGLSTTEGLAAQILVTVQRGCPISWLDSYASQVEALTVEQVNTAIKKHLKPDAMTLVLAGTLPAAQ